jgi:mannose-1-phosphate guanylyltransferase / mannose-6-phosphate isomerase
MIKVSPVILCGGSGSRLWPLSRSSYPKQFLALTGSASLFQQSIARINNLKCLDISVGESVIVTNEEHRFLAIEQLTELKDISAKILLEPTPKNTAPALALAALYIAESGDDSVMVVCPADQIIKNEVAFNKTIQSAITLAADGAIVILGINPDKPETGYGYIEQSGNPGAQGEFIVNQFKEKPDLETAKSYLNSKNYTWNSGIFILRASTWLKALRHFSPSILIKSEIAWELKTVDVLFIRPDKKAFVDVASDSIDYAVLEKCPGSIFPIYMLPLIAGWGDLGAWDAVWHANQTNPSEDHGNVIKGDALLINTKDSLVHSSSRLVGTVGVKNLIVIETSDAVLVADREHSQDVKSLIQKLVLEKRQELHLHRKVYRPWGWYDNIDAGERFKVKRIQVNPGESLSLQMHHHRAEHWVVVKGTAEITNGDQIFILTENQSTYIPVGVIHRLTNAGDIPLEIIEVQSGDYLEEDDIVRFEDSYGRAAKII